MTPPHTPESLLAMTKSPEGLEQLRIIAAEFDEGYYLIGTPEDDGLYGYSLRESKTLNRYPWRDTAEEAWLDGPEYTTSLDAIFAAEERLGLHNEANRKLRAFWYVSASKYFDPVWADASQRTAIFILTAQWKAQNL